MSMGLLGCLLGCQSNQAVQADREYEITEYEITIAPKTDAWLGGGAARVLALGADGLTTDEPVTVAACADHSSVRAEQGSSRDAVGGINDTLVALGYARWALPEEIVVETGRCAAILGVRT
ncbi:MAG: hypothetical protein P8R54_14265 [Myxococcota bacterium]|nr:hypothetical protein [Myxococcota bacterium]